MKQAKSDELLLSAWAGPAAQSVADGYDYIASSRNITRKRAKRVVHKTLERLGYNPHTGPRLIQIWLHLHRGYLKYGETE